MLHGNGRVRTIAYVREEVLDLEEILVARSRQKRVFLRWRTLPWKRASSTSLPGSSSNEWGMSGRRTVDSCQKWSAPPLPQWSSVRD